MKILYHHRTQAEDAQGIHIYEIIKAFQDNGHEVEKAMLVELEGEGGKRVKGRSWKYLVKWVPGWLYELMGVAYNLYGYLDICRTIKTKRPDLIYERYSLNTFCGVLASRRFKIPLVLEVNAPLYHEQKRLGRLTFKRLSRFLEQWICSQSSLTIVVSNELRKILIHEGVPNEKIQIIPNGIDPFKFHPDVSGKEVKRRYNLEGKLVVGFVGWFRQWHGLEMLLEIMRDINMAENNVRLLLAGDGPAYQDLYRYAEIHNLMPFTIFTGPVSRLEIPGHIAAMDIAVQPSATEYACPMKIFEYMGMGKCIVAPDQANIREILQNKVNCYLFRPGDREHFKRVLLDAIYNPVDRKAIGKNAYTTIHERQYLWSSNVKKTMNLVFGDSI